MPALPGVFEHNYAISILPQAIAFPLFRLFASPLSSTFFPALRILQRVPESGDSSDILVACSNGKSVGIVSGGRR